ncbi:MAG: carbohydrate-binding protein, partial [Chitinispirillaceae bacterium]|nr:carbohydrate-binding protein [Chitinispirillaceae bacterium]
PIVNNGGPCIDPTVLIDDDGQAYMYWGNPDAYYVKLNKDMVSYSGDIVKIPKQQSYQEGPWLYKKNNRYYLAWSSTCCPEGIGYAMSDSPTGPWTFKGSIMDGNSNSSGNQPGIFDFKGATYTTGFTNELWFSIQGGRTTRYERRSANLVKLSFNADGTIPKVPWFGVGNPTPGVPQVGSFYPYDTVQAETICWSKGVRTEVCKDVSGKMDVDSIHDGDLIKVKGVDFGENGAESFMARVASGSSGGKIELRLDTLTGPLAGTCTVSGTGGWQTWKTVTCDVSGAKGKHDLYFKFTGGSGLLFNFNWWKFISGETAVFGDASGNARKDIVLAFNSRILRLTVPPALSYEKITVSLFDMGGRMVEKVYDARPGALQVSLPLPASVARSGVYLVRIAVNSNEVAAKKVTLQ